MFPSEKRMCHRTGFALGCRALVADGKCERWANLDVIDPQTKEKRLIYNCMDDFQVILLAKLGNAQNETTASIDKTHNGNERRHTETVSATMAIAHRILRDDAGPRLNGDEPPLMLEAAQ